VKSLFKVVLGLVIGVGLAELAFSARDSGAFPHLNLYEADAELGVRLQPDTSMKLRVADNDVTTVQINSSGFAALSGPPPPKAKCWWSVTARSSASASKQIRPSRRSSQRS
jgi:hypothetical protein